MKTTGYKDNKFSADKSRENSKYVNPEMAKKACMDIIQIPENYPRAFLLEDNAPKSSQIMLSI